MEYYAATLKGSKLPGYEAKTQQALITQMAAHFHGSDKPAIVNLQSVGFGEDGEEHYLTPAGLALLEVEIEAQIQALYANDISASDFARSATPGAR